MSLALAIISMNIILNTISAEGCVVWMPSSNMRVLHEEMIVAVRMCCTVRKHWFYGGTSEARLCCHCGG
jgi:hypothetical protein